MHIPNTEQVPEPKHKDVMGYGLFTAATYGTRCPAHEYGTECHIHATGNQVPYFAAVKDPNPINGLLYTLGIFLI